MNELNRAGPKRRALYMVHMGELRPVPLPPGYQIEHPAWERKTELRAIIELEGAMRDDLWRVFSSRVLPGGAILIRETATGAAVGTASAIHNPDGARFHFPGGGELGYMIVHPDHRGRHLGSALAADVVGCFRNRSYRNIWLGVQESRLPAVATCLGAGFRPFLHPPAAEDLENRWRAVFEALGRPFSASECLSQLP